MKKLGINFNDIRPPGQQKLYAANNSEMRTLGKIQVQIKYGNFKTSEEITICDT